MALTYRCVICKKAIAEEEAGPHGLDPCGLVLISKVFADPLERKQQSFWCHSECFRKLNDDDASLPILERDFCTPRDFLEEKRQQTDVLSRIGEMLTMNASQSFWDSVLSSSCGMWQPVSSLLRDASDALLAEFAQVQEEVMCDVVIAWTRRKDGGVRQCFLAAEDFAAVKYVDIPC